MALADRVHVTGRFQRSVRVDLDLGDPAALEGFVCPPSSAEVLETMVGHIAENGHGAFTWTGPYGSGKSSLAVALSALLNASPSLRRSAVTALSEGTASMVWAALPPRRRGWRILPVVGRRDRPAQVVGEAIEAAGLVTEGPPKRWTEKQVLDALKGIAAEHPRAGGGLMVIIDEMGKFLESAAYDGSDVYFFQQIAEVASHSSRRLVVVGILHQAFEEYAHRLSREARDEWAKIQGRFVDLAVNTRGNEQIDLLSRAIETNRRPQEPGPIARGVAALARVYTSPDLPMTLEECWPLHPIVACLLGPISRRRFGQNQRSIFGFLNSAEPQGFQHFLRDATDGDLYTPDLLWDYLRTNLEPSIMASPDGHRWASAVDALERCHAMGGGGQLLRVLKTIALVGILRERSGLAVSSKLLRLALHDCGADEIAGALARLQEWSLVIYRKFDDSYSVFDGSDFDVEHAVSQAMESADVDFGRLEALAGLQPVVAKRHYHETGALRWFDVRIVPVAEIEEAVSAYAPRNGAVGAFLLAIPTRGESDERAREYCHNAVREATEWDIVVGLPQGPWDIDALVRELLALEQIRDGAPELQGDRVARREIEGRTSYLQGYIESELVRAFNSARWYRKGHRAQPLGHGKLNGLASDLADDRFFDSPWLYNELLNRSRPSSNAVAAQNALLRQMVLHEGEERLGIDGYPAEGGLFESLLSATWLYGKTPDGWRFTVPERVGFAPVVGDPCNLAPIWNAAAEFLEDNADRTVSVAEIYDVWRQPPYGVKDGVLPILIVAFILSKRSTVVSYRNGIFQSSMTDLDTDYLSKDPESIQLRWMDLSDASRRLLSDMADVVRGMDTQQALAELEPIDVARGLVSIYDRLPLWVDRTQRLSANAKRLRQLFKQASDPNRLIFDEIPKALSDGHDPADPDGLAQVTASITDGLYELQQAFPSMLRRLREVLLTELEVPNLSEAVLAELQARAENVRQLSGDHRLEAFIIRLIQFQGSDWDMESLASLATSKPAAQWVDPDIDRAAVELADLAQQFKRVEAYAHVKGRPDRRHAMALVVGTNRRVEPLRGSFDVTDMDREGVDKLVTTMNEILAVSGEERRNIILAALVELSAQYLAPATADDSEASVSEKEAV